MADRLRVEFDSTPGPGIIEDFFFGAETIGDFAAIVAAHANLETDQLNPTASPFPASDLDPATFSLANNIWRMLLATVQPP